MVCMKHEAGVVPLENVKKWNVKKKKAVSC